MKQEKAFKSIVRCGKQTWFFPQPATLQETAVAVGPKEGQGPLGKEFDIVHEDIWLKQDSFEKAEKQLFSGVCDRLLEKAGLMPDQIDLLIAGDLLNQIVSANFTARAMAIPYLGIFGACSTAVEGLILASQIVASGGADRVIALTGSHNSTAEKQYRYPNEYGSQKPPYAQWTVTGAGAGLVSMASEGPYITCTTIGQVVDMGITDPFNMGAVMAPAAAHTIAAHLKERNVPPEYYDLIVTGDLGEVGHKLTTEMLAKQGINLDPSRFTDGGLLIYDREKQDVFSGGSGCGCIAAVTYGHLFKELKRGKLNKILVAATGALLSPVSVQQQETIPGISHAIALERGIAEC